MVVERNLSRRLWNADLVKGILVACLLNVGVPSAWAQGDPRWANFEKWLDNASQSELRQQFKKELRERHGPILWQEDMQDIDKKRIIRIAQRLDPPPAIPEEAEKYMGRAQAAVRQAQGPDDYRRALKEFEKVQRLAPWWPPAYFNLALIYEKALDYEAAIRNFNLYLFAAPNASDAGEVRAKIGEIEYQLERLSKIRFLFGVWKAYEYENWSSGGVATKNLVGQLSPVRLVWTGQAIEGVKQESKIPWLRGMLRGTGVDSLEWVMWVDIPPSCQGLVSGHFPVSAYYIYDPYRIGDKEHINIWFRLSGSATKHEIGNCKNWGNYTHNWLLSSRPER